jgi:hypothetical protein
MSGSSHGVREGAEQPEPGGLSAASLGEPSRRGAELGGLKVRERPR